eukprot:COSAG02_NODE_970_length_15551_cov_4.985698_1_plen_117_part_00
MMVEWLVGDNGGRARVICSFICYRCDLSGCTLPKIMHTEQSTCDSYMEQVVHVGSTEWCVGLQTGREEPIAEQITKNTLDGMLSHGYVDSVTSTSLCESTANCKIAKLQNCKIAKL